MSTSFYVPKPAEQGAGRWAEFIRRKDEIAGQLAGLGYNEQSDIWIASTENARVCSAKGELALRRIAEGTHRLASEGEVEKFLADQKVREAEYKGIERANKERDGKGASASEIADALKSAFGDPGTPARPGRGKPADKD